MILEELREAGSVHLSTVLRAIDFTQDEHLRFHLWNLHKPCFAPTAYEFLLKLDEPETLWNRSGRDCRTMTDIETSALIQGLSVQDAHLEQAPERYEPAHDVEQHWQTSTKRKKARVYQAILLLCLGLKKEEKGLYHPYTGALPT